MTTLEVLYAAWALVDTPEKWCQGALHKDNAYCAVGACYAGVGFAGGIPYNDGAPYRAGNDAINALTRAIGNPDVWLLCQWNNASARTHADIMALFARAIRAEEAKVSVRDGMGDVAGLGVGR